MKRIWKLLVLAGLVLGFSGDAAAEEAKAGGDTVVIHYNRPDGNYDGWGLHVWQSFQKKEEAADEWAAKEMPDAPVGGVTWFKPMKPTGKDDFGIFWAIPAKEFGNGRVNYIIHKGDKKDQCSKDMFWTIDKGRENWVVAGDCTIHLSKDEALKAKK